MAAGDQTTRFGCVQESDACIKSTGVTEPRLPTAFGGIVVRLMVVGLLLPVAALAAMGWLFFNAPAEDTTTGTVLPREPQLVATDSSGNGNHGVNQGSPVLGLPGHAGTSYSFDRLGSWVQVPSHSSLNPGTDDFMFSAWVNFTVEPQPGETYDIIRKGLAYTASGEFKVEIMPRGRVKCSAKDSDGHEAWVIDGEADVADGSWHLIGCARVGRTWSVFVGPTVTSKRTELGSISNTFPLAIGSKYGQEDVPQGSVDEVKLVIAANTSSAGRLATRIKSLRSQAPTGWWRLDEVTRPNVPG
ncbi:MAG TPA: LamG-like jellyroll fold domain-containing protein [Nocardioidaceae bacterium]|nr:LamG-like jellyroll fold domain-containing protein [Nocardioidaceae bacterium]